METIHADERAALLRALELAQQAEFAIPLTDQQINELKSVLADGTIRLLMRPKEKSFSVPARIQVLAADELDATNVVESLLNGGINGSDASDCVVGWLIGDKEPDPARQLHTVALLLNRVRELEDASRTAAGVIDSYRTTVAQLATDVEALKAEVRILRDPRIGASAAPNFFNSSVDPEVLRQGQQLARDLMKSQEVPPGPMDSQPRMNPADGQSREP